MKNDRYVQHRTIISEDYCSNCCRNYPRLWFYTKSLILLPLFFAGVFFTVNGLISAKHVDYQPVRINDQTTKATITTYDYTFVYIGAVLIGTAILLQFFTYLCWGMRIELNSIEDIQKKLAKTTEKNNRATIISHLMNIHNLILSMKTEFNVEIINIKLDCLIKLIQKTESYLKRMKIRVKSPISAWEKYCCCLDMPCFTCFNKEYKIQISNTITFIDAILSALEKIKQDVKRMFIGLELAKNRSRQLNQIKPSKSSQSMQNKQIISLV